MPDKTANGAMDPAMLDKMDGMDARPSALAPAVTINGPAWLEKMLEERRSAKAAPTSKKGPAKPLAKARRPGLR